MTSRQFEKLAEASRQDGFDQDKLAEALKAILKAEELSNEISSLNMKLYQLLVGVWREFYLLAWPLEGGQKEEEK